MGVGSRGQLDRDCPLHFSKVLFRRFYSAMRTIRAELSGEFLVYNYTPEYGVRKVKKIDFLELVMGAENIKI